jgi:signal recognition particle subunit SRP54
MYEQLISLQKMGGFGRVLRMMGGQNLPKEAKEMAEGNMGRIKVIIQSCTPEERENPALIKKTRITRIARGSGTTYTEVKGMLKNWKQMNSMMKNLLGKKRRGRGKGGAQSGLPGIDGLPGGMDMGKIQQMMGQQGKKRKKHPW